MDEVAYAIPSLKTKPPPLKTEGVLEPDEAERHWIPYADFIATNIAGRKMPSVSTCELTPEALLPYMVPADAATSGYQYTGVCAWMTYLLHIGRVVGRIPADAYVLAVSATGMSRQLPGLRQVVWRKATDGLTESVQAAGLAADGERRPVLPLAFGPEWMEKRMWHDITSYDVGKTCRLFGLLDVSASSHTAWSAWTGWYVLTNRNHPPDAMRDIVQQSQIEIGAISNWISHKYVKPGTPLGVTVEGYRDACKNFGCLDNRRTRAAVASVLHAALKSDGEAAGIIYAWDDDLRARSGDWIDSLAVLEMAELISHGISIERVQRQSRLWRVPNDILDFANDYCSAEANNTLRDRLESSVPTGEIKTEYEGVLRELWDGGNTYTGPAAILVHDATKYIVPWYVWLGRYNIVNKLRSISARPLQCSAECRAALAAHGLPADCIDVEDPSTCTATLADCNSALEWLLSDKDTVCTTCYAMACNRIERASPVCISRGLGEALDPGPCYFNDEAVKLNCLYTCADGVLERILHYILDTMRPPP